MKLLEGKFRPGQTVEVGYKGGEFTFEVKQREPAAVGS